MYCCCRSEKNQDQGVVNQGVVNHDVVNHDVVNHDVVKNGIDMFKDYINSRDNTLQHKPSKLEDARKLSIFNTAK